MILPAESVPADTTSWIIARDLEEVLNAAGWQTAVCFSQAGFRQSVRCECPSPAAKNGLFLSDMKPPRSREETLFLRGLLDRSRLKKDIAAIRKAIADVRPDTVFELCRPAAVIAARLEKIPCVSYIPPGTNRDRLFPAKCLQDLNRVLSDVRLEQVLRLRDLYDGAALKYTFGTDFLFSRETDVRVFGSLSVHTKRREADGHVTVFFGGMERGFAADLVRDCFLGAPYDVCAWLGGSAPSSEGRLKITSVPRPEMIAGSSVCIHDGSDAVFTRCLYLGVPQIIINDGSLERDRNASALIRCGTGISLNESAVDVASLYENYRKMLTNPVYQKKADRIASVLSRDSDLSAILQYL